MAVGLRARGGLATVGFGLLIGGGVANVVDRLSATPHQVTDFIALGSFPVFNLADVAITVGFITLLGGRVDGREAARVSDDESSTPSTARRSI